MNKQWVFYRRRLDRSVALATSDHPALAEPRIERIAE